MTPPSVITKLLRLLATSADCAARWRFAAAALLVAAGGLLAALSPLLLKEMVDAVAALANAPPQRPPSALLLFGAGYLLAIGGGRLLGELRALLAGTAERRVLARLTQRLFGHLLSLQLQEHLARKPGALVHSLHMATTGCQMLTAHLVGTLLPVVVELATVSAVLLHLDQPVLLLTFAATALSYLVLFGIGAPRLSEQARRVSGASVDVNATLTDTLLNCEAVKCFGAEPASRQRLAGATETLVATWLRLYRLRFGLGLAVAATFVLSMAASLFVAAQGVAAGTLTIGGFVLANLYMLQIVRPLEAIGTAARDVSEAIGFIRPMLDVLDLQPEEPRLQQAWQAPIDTTASPRRETAAAARTAGGAHAPTIRFAGVCFGYDAQRPVLRDLDLDVGAGRALAIVGASGSGKSSLVRLLMRLYEPQTGQILLDGRPIGALEADDVRSIVGLVPQDTVLFNDTLANNIGLGRPGAGREDIEVAARRAQLHDFVESLPSGYDTMVGERGLKLSGGERQRVAIARVLLKAPRVYVFDEATSMLDSQTEAAILAELRSIAEGCTTITIAHRLSTVRDADEIAVLDEGEIKERGTHAALLSQRGIYAGLWQRQMALKPA